MSVNHEAAQLAILNGCWTDDQLNFALVVIIRDKIHLIKSFTDLRLVTAVKGSRWVFLLTFHTGKEGFGVEAFLLVAVALKRVSHDLCFTINVGFGFIILKCK